jgi:predicted Zn-dependent protease
MRAVQNTGTILLLVAGMLAGWAPSAHARGILSTSMEVELGRSVRDDVLSEYEQWDDPADNALVSDLAAVLVPLAEQREGIDYEFYLIESEDINAFAAPGGFVFISTGLLDFIKRDPGMLGGVMAHEIGHVARRHHRKAIEEALWHSLGFAVLLRTFDIDEEWIEIAGAAALTLIEQGHSREHEYDADRQAVLMTYRAGWDPDAGIICFLRDIEKEYGSGNPLGDIGRCIASHPDTDRRVYFAELYLEEVRASEPFTPQPLPELQVAEEEEETQAVEEKPADDLADSSK